MSVSKIKVRFDRAYLGVPALALLVATGSAALAQTPTNSQAVTDVRAMELQRAAERFANCILVRDLACLSELADLDAYWSLRPRDIVWINIPATSPVYPIRMRGSTASEFYVRNDQYSRKSYRHIELEPARDIVTDSGESLTLLPYRAVYVDSLPETDRRVDLSAYFIAFPVNRGDGWRFVDIGPSLWDYAPWELERLLAADAIRRLPPLAYDSVTMPEMTRSRYLQTRIAEFTNAGSGDDAAYRVALEIEKRIRRPIELVVTFDNPVGEGLSARVDAVLLPGQKQFEIRSPVMSGFADLATYNVTIEGYDRKKDQQVFEHRQSVLFDSLLQSMVATTAQATLARGHCADC